MRKHFYVAVSCALLAGCAYFPDFELTPSARLPVAEVVNQIRCDMYAFLKDHRSGTAAFSLDDDSYATVELSLATTSSGDVKFAKIDTIGLGATNWLAVDPFPSLGGKQQGEVTTKVTVNIAQNPDLLRPLCENGPRYGYAEVFSDKPYADRVLINQMRVSAWLKRTFESADRIVPSGPFCNSKAKGPDGGNLTLCSVGLDNATLTTKFQLVGDASGGLLSLEKLVPVVATPTLALKLDYSHQIKIIFQGNNILDKSQPHHVADRPTTRMMRRPFTVDRKLCESLPPGPNRDDCFNNLGAQVVPNTSGVERQLRSIRDALILNSR